MDLKMISDNELQEENNNCEEILLEFYHLNFKENCHKYKVRFLMFFFSVHNAFDIHGR